MKYLGPKLEDGAGKDAFPPTVLADVTGLTAALAARVQTVNNVAPDGSGDIHTLHPMAAAFIFGA